MWVVFGLREGFVGVRLVETVPEVTLLSMAFDPAGWAFDVVA